MEEVTSHKKEKMEHTIINLDNPISMMMLGLLNILCNKKHYNYGRTRRYFGSRPNDVKLFKGKGNLITMGNIKSFEEFKKVCKYQDTPICIATCCESICGYWYDYKIYKNGKERRIKS